MIHHKSTRLPSPAWLGRAPWAMLVLVLAALALSPWPVVTLALVGVFAILAARWLDRALCLLPLTFPYWYVPRPLIGQTVFPLSELAIAACVLAALAHELAPLYMRLRPSPSPSPSPRRRASRPHEHHDPADHPGAALTARLPHAVRSARQRWQRLPQTYRWLLAATAAFALGLTLGVLVARMPREALRAWRWEVLEPLVYAVLVLRYVRPGRRSVGWLVGALLASASVLAALAIVQTLWWHVTITTLASGNRLVPYLTAAGDVPRATALVFGSGNALGAWMARALPLALAVAATAAFGRRARLLALACAIACALALVWSGSRGALLAAGTAALVVLALTGSAPRWGWLRRWWPLALAGLAALALWRGGAVAALLAEHPGAAALRPLLWLAALHMILDHPILGIGPDQFLYYYSNLYTDHPYWITVFNDARTEVWREPNLSHPHNLALELWLSGGLLALAGFAVVLAITARDGWRTWQANHNAATPAAGQRAAFALGVIGSLLAGMLHGLVDSAYFAPDLALLFWWAVVMMVLLTASSTAKE